MSGDLIARLRANSDAHVIGYPKPRRQTAEELAEAADALDAKDKRIAELEAALVEIRLTETPHANATVRRICAVAKNALLSPAPPSSPVGDANG